MSARRKNDKIIGVYNGQLIKGDLCVKSMMHARHVRVCVCALHSRETVFCSETKDQGAGGGSESLAGLAAAATAAAFIKMDGCTAARLHYCLLHLHDPQIWASPAY